MDRRQARAVLGIPALYTLAEVDDAFRRGAWEAHPDRGGSQERFHELAEARRALRSRPPSSAPVVVVDDTHPLRRLLRGRSAHSRRRRVV